MATIYCMNCGIELEEGTRFCPECGSPTLLGAGLLEGEDPTRLPCPSCGFLNDADSYRCEACGQRLAQDVPHAYLPSNEARAIYGIAERERHADRWSTLPVGAVAAVAVIAVVLGGLGIWGVLGASRAARSSQQEQAVVVTEDEPGGATDTGSAGVEVRAGLADYSWEELSIIGKALTRQASRDEALKMAREYNLTDDAGHILEASKDVELTGLGTLYMRLVDVYHDDLANGEGKAGLSLLATNAELTHRMNATNDITGGWEASELRSWLNTTVLGCMDETLRTSIMAVDKHTDNVGHTTDASSVTSTFDVLWLPSMAEVVGPINWTWPSDPSNSSGYNAIANAEGSQYALFAEQGVVALEANAGLVVQGASGPVAWWERSASPSGSSQFRAVSEAGDPTRIYGASSELGVCLGFCL